MRAIYLAHDGSVWIAGGAGVMRCRDDGCVSVGVAEGLPEASAWTLFEDSAGRLLVGTTAGLSVAGYVAGNSLDQGLTVIHVIP